MHSITKTLLSSCLLLAVCQHATILASEIPKYIHICSRNNPKLNECIKKSVDELKPHLKNGIPELGVPSMEPLDIGDLTILEGGTGSFNVKAKNLKILGASDFKIRKFVTTSNITKFDFDLLLPRLQGEGSYDVSGQLLALPLKGNGPFSGNFTNFMAFVQVKFDRKTVDNVEYINIRSLNVRIKTGKGRVRLSNLFNGDKALGDIINETINQNFEVFTTELIHPIERALEKKFLSIGSQIFTKFSFNQLFPV